MKLIGLTGGIASGKSTVTAMIRKEGYTVICADEVSREVSEKGQAGYLAILNAFGSGFLEEDGSLNRKRLGAYVFSNSEALKKLNSILHPIILDAIREKAKNVGDICFVDAALLIESGLYREMDELWLVTADENVRMQRLKKRDGITEEEAMRRMLSQMKETDKNKYASKIIDNTGAIDTTQRQVQNLLRQLKKV